MGFITMLTDISDSCYPNPKIIPNTYNSASQKLASPISEVRPYLFISGYGSVSAKKLRELGITHVIDATNIPNTHAKDVEYLEVPISDNEREVISKYFQPAADFIRASKDKVGFESTKPTGALFRAVRSSYFLALERADPQFSA